MAVFVVYKRQNRQPYRPNSRPRGNSFTTQEYDDVSHYSGITNDPDIGYAGIPRFSTIIFRGLGHSFSFLCCIFAKTTNL